MREWSAEERDGLLQRIAPDVKLGRNVRIYAFVNLYGCEIGDETSVGTFEKMIDLNLRSAFLCCRAALRRMRGEGRIVNVAAITAAQLSKVGGSAAYAASKAGLIALTKAIAEEAMAAGIRCNCVAPGTMRTPQNGDAPGQVPLEDVAEGIAYLLSPAAGALSGAVLTFPAS